MYSEIKNPRRWLLTAALKEAADSSPETVWLEDSEGGALTFGQAQTYSLRAAGFLARHGVARDERVGVFLFNGCDFAIAWLGLGQLAATAVFLNTDLRGAFLRHQINDSEIRDLIVDAALLPAITELAPELPRLRHLIVVGGNAKDRAAPDGWTRSAWPDWAREPDWSASTPPAPEDIACIMYTSGTSGPSKGVLMPHAHCALYGIGAIESMGLGPGDRYYVCLPMYHANALFMQIGATLLAGIPAFVRRRFSASQWLADVREHGSTATNMLGAVSAFVVNQPPTGQDRDHALRVTLNAPDIAAHDAIFRERFGIRDVLPGYGMTECNIPAWGRIGDPAPGTAGWILKEYFDVQIFDPETDEALPPGQVGEIVVRPRAPFGFMAGYFNQPQKTVESWRNLWFHTGDLGTLSADGLLRFVDRVKDMIRRRAENISPAEIEQVVAVLPGVAEVAAYAVHSEIAGGEDEIMLAVVPRPGATLDPADIVRRARTQLPRFARPRYIKLMDELPKTGNGKVRRVLLREQGLAGARDIPA